jgi:hypothetical protein
MGESYVVVSGKLLLEHYVDTSRTSKNNPVCILTLLRNDDESQVDWREITEIFKEGFVVPSINADYKILLSCENYKQFVSNKFRLGEKEPFGKQVTLGEIKLERSPH